MDYSQNPIFKKYPDIFLQEISETSPYFKVRSQDESAVLYNVSKVRVFEGFICTLDKLHTYLGQGQLKPEYIAILLLDFFEAVQTQGIEHVLPYFMLHSSQLVLV